MPSAKLLTGKESAAPAGETFALAINPRNLNGLSSRERYGWVGKGMQIILSNQHIREIVQQHNLDEIVVSNEGVHGIERMQAPEQFVLDHLLKTQFGRSVPILAKARSGELDQYDDVSIGVVKGVLVGGLVGVALDSAGFKGTIPEMIARLGPGALESSAITHELQVKEKRQEATLSEKVVRAVKELPQDAINIARRIPNGLYGAVNLYGALDRLRGRNVAQNGGQTNTEVWATAQESGPYRGIIALAALKIADGYIRPEQNSPLGGVYKIAYDAAESLAVFWVNTGNNVQGFLGVYGIIKDAGKKRIEAFNETIADPFQLANL